MYQNVSNTMKTLRKVSFRNITYFRPFLPIMCHDLIFNLSIVHFFSNIVSAQRAVYSLVSQLLNMAEVEICTRNTLCEMMMMDDVINWITWLVCNSQTRHRFLMTYLRWRGNNLKVSSLHHFFKQRNFKICLNLYKMLKGTLMQIWKSVNSLVFIWT